ncbi:MAG: MBL fold metallo-hydrolase [Oscillospiraceae bacterium]|nr:MBL fold metallo-hydrolase [Oscillospiraceae bacterium]
MEFRYFGTGAAECWPALFCSCDNCKRAAAAGGRNIRTRSQAAVNGDLLIDLPPDTYFHVIRNGLELTKIKYILFTHSHEDHFYLYDLHRTYPPYAHGEKSGRIEKINIYGNKSINAHAEKFENYGDILEFFEIRAFEKFKAGSYSVTPLKADHDSSQDCFIYMIEDEKSKILYAHDTGYFPEETWDYLKAEAGGKKFDFVSLDATYGHLDSRRGHMGIDAGNELKGRLIEIKAAAPGTVFCFNHFSHNGKYIYDELAPIAEKMGFLVSYDGMGISV